MDERELEQVIARLRLDGTDDQLYEAKSCAGGLPGDIGRTVSAFANGGGGTILCGIDESRGFRPAKGFDVARIQDALANFCIQRMTPAIHPFLDIIPFDGSVVLVAHIPELRPKEKPCFITASGQYGGSYLRTGDGDRRLSYYEVDRLISERTQPLHDQEPVKEAHPEDLDPRLVAALIARERNLHPHHFSELDDTAILCKLHALARDKRDELHPTLAGLLALGRYPQEFFPRLTIAFTRYGGTQKATETTDGRRFLDSLTLAGPIPDMVNDAVDAVRRNMRIGSRIEGAFRYDVPDYPETAVREAVVNALMHRDYSPDARGTAVAVDMYADRLEVISPGGLYGTVTVESLGDGFAPGSCRNQRLATLLESTPASGSSASASGRFVAENRGTGFLVMQRELARYGKPAPVAHNSLSHFRLVLHNEQPTAKQLPSEAAHVQRAAANLAESGAEETVNPFDKIEYGIVELAKAQETVTISELTTQLGKSRPTIRKRVADLVQRGILTPIGAANSPQRAYRITR